MSSTLIQGFVEVLKLAPRYLAAVAIVTGVLLLPKQFTDAVYVSDFAQDYRQWIGLAFIAAVALWSVGIFCEIVGIVRKVMRDRKSHKRFLQGLHRLTEEEKQILLVYIAKETKTHKLPVNSGIVNGLISRGFIFRSSKYAEWSLPTWLDHNIVDSVWEHLKKNAELLLPADWDDEVVVTDQDVSDQVEQPVPSASERSNHLKSGTGIVTG